MGVGLVLCNHSVYSVNTDIDSSLAQRFLTPGQFFWPKGESDCFYLKLNRTGTLLRAYVMPSVVIVILPSQYNTFIARL